jgi:hypothetical protein
MATAAELAIRIRGDDQASDDLRRVGRNTRDLQGDVTNLGTQGGSAIGKFTTALGRIGLAAMGIDAVASAVKGLGNILGIGLVSEMEIITAKIQAFTKDMDATRAILREVELEAQKTPFAFAEMADAVTALIPVSKLSGKELMELVRLAEILAASNPLQGLSGAAFSLREALSGDFVSIIERFNLSRSTLNRLKAEGVPALEAIEMALEEIGLDADAVTNLAGTMSGRWGKLQDTFDVVRRRAATPLFDLLSTGLDQVGTLLDNNLETVNAWADAFGRGLATAVGTVFQLAAGVAELMSGGGSQQLRGGLESIFGEGNALAEALTNIASVLPGAVDTIGRVMDRVSDVIQKFVGDGPGFTETLGNIILEIQKLSKELNENYPAATEAAAIATGVLLGRMKPLRAAGAAGVLAATSDEIGEGFPAATLASGLAVGALVSRFHPLVAIASALALIFFRDLIPSSDELKASAQRLWPEVKNVGNFLFESWQSGSALSGRLKEMPAAIVPVVESFGIFATRLREAREAFRTGDWDRAFRIGFQGVGELVGNLSDELGQWATLAGPAIEEALGQIGSRIESGWPKVKEGFNAWIADFGEWWTYEFVPGAIQAILKGNEDVKPAFGEAGKGAGEWLGQAVIDAVAFFFGGGFSKFYFAATEFIANLVLGLIYVLFSPESAIGNFVTEFVKAFTGKLAGEVVKQATHLVSFVDTIISTIKAELDTKLQSITMPSLEIKLPDFSFVFPDNLLASLVEQLKQFLIDLAPIPGPLRGSSSDAFRPSSAFTPATAGIGGGRTQVFIGGNEFYDFVIKTMDDSNRQRTEIGPGVTAQGSDW